MTTRYTYDSMDRLFQVLDGKNSNVLVNYEYTFANKIEKLRYGNRVTSKLQYQDDGSIQSLVSVNTAGKVLLNYEYTYDENGNCIKKIWGTISE